MVQQLRGSVLRKFMTAAVNLIVMTNKWKIYISMENLEAVSDLNTANNQMESL